MYLICRYKLTCNSMLVVCNYIVVSGREAEAWSSNRRSYQRVCVWGKHVEYAAMSREIINVLITFYSRTSVRRNYYLYHTLENPHSGAATACSSSSSLAAIPQSTQNIAYIYICMYAWRGALTAGTKHYCIH